MGRMLPTCQDLLKPFRRNRERNEVPQLRVLPPLQTRLGWPEPQFDGALARLRTALDKSLWLGVYCKLQRSRTPALLPRADSIGAGPRG